MMKTIRALIILLLTLSVGACGSGAPAAAPTSTLPPLPTACARYANLCANADGHAAARPSAAQHRSERGPLA